MNFPFLPKMLFGQPQAPKGKQCCIVSVSPSGLLIKLQVHRSGVAFLFAYYGFLLLRLLFCLFLFNNCTGAFDGESRGPLSQSGPELQSTCGSEIRAEQGKVELAQETRLLALL